METISSKSKTFHIIFGWAEGPWHGQKLTNTLLDSGYKEAAVEEADIILTHSAGAYLIPKSSNNKTMLVIGLPYWPDRSLALRCVQKIWHDFLAHRHQPLYWLHKTSWNIFYIVSHPFYNLKVSRAARNKNNLTFHSQAIIVRNKEDAFCTPKISDYFQNKIVELPGQHDDCWQNPEQYITLMQTINNS